MALELNDVLRIETKDGLSLPFEVVGIVEDADGGGTYAVLLHETPEGDDGEFIVTDLDGHLLENEGLAREIVDDFLGFAEDAE